MKLLTLDEIKTEYKNNPYVQDQDNPYELIDFFQRLQSGIKQDIEQYNEVSEKGVIMNWNSMVCIEGVYYKDAKDYKSVSSSSVANNICKLTNSAVSKEIIDNIIPELLKKTDRIDHIIYSLMDLHLKMRK